MQDYEKLGAFYLGKVRSPDTGATSDDLVLYDARDLTTHAVCVGMTGSGKTGLCIGLIEEAAIDGIPALVIDPKGDLANLMLTFPNLAASDFAPWVDPEEARRKGISTEQLAQQTAERWQKGLASWGEDGGRIQRLRDVAEFVVYTPGSRAGRPLSILKSFAAPPPALRDDADWVREPRARSRACSAC
jgi:DNA helicase HerA-like ATPase